ncbi:MAG: helix-turn-helix domain-containing protein [Bilophila wadsworthia]
MPLAQGDAAEALGLNLRTLQRKMKRLGMGDRMRR